VRGKEICNAEKRRRENKELMHARYRDVIFNAAAVSFLMQG